MDEAPARPNILVLLSDEHSASAVGCYGAGGVETPAIDRLAREGVLFESAYCNAPVCVPSRLSFMSGKYSWRIGAWTNASSPPEDHISIASRLSASGYETIAFGKMHYVGADKLWGWERRPYGDIYGLSHQPDPIASAPDHQLHPGGPAEIAEHDMQESIVTRLGIDFLEHRVDTRPFFLWLSYNKPHFPHRPPQRWFDKYYPDGVDLPYLPEGHLQALHPWLHHHRRFYGVENLSEDTIRRGRAGYFGNVSFVDEQVGKVLDALERLGMSENTIVVYFSDHGEMYGEHGLWRKSCFYEEAVRVPLIVRSPDGTGAGSRRRELVELVDLYPTFLEMAGLPSSVGDIDGVSLLSLIRPSGSRWRKDSALSEYYTHSVPGPMRMLRHGDWKYCQYLDARPSLFNLRDDPREFEDLADSDPSARKIGRELDALLRADWDERVVRATYEYAPSMQYLQVHKAERTPNQYLDENGIFMDAETFYADVDWSSLSLYNSDG